MWNKNVLEGVWLSVGVALGLCSGAKCVLAFRDTAAGWASFLPKPPDLLRKVAIDCLSSHLSDFAAGYQGSDGIKWGLGFSDAMTSESPLHEAWQYLAMVLDV